MFDKLRAAAQGSSQPVDQAEALVERAASDPVAFVGIAVNFQVMETLDFTGNLGYILPGDEGGDAINLADSLQLYCGHRRIQHQ
ncbi:hypothetical protein D3C76_1154270 [compost metagenome]